MEQNIPSLLGTIRLDFFALGGVGTLFVLGVAINDFVLSSTSLVEILGDLLGAGLSTNVLLTFWLIVWE